MNLSKTWLNLKDYRVYEGYWGLVLAVMRKLLRPLSNLAREVRWRRFKDRHGSDLVTTVAGLRIHLNPSDSGISAELATEGIHEPILTKLLPSFVTPGMTVIDIGANIGYFALIESGLVGPEGSIIALEPYPPSFLMLQKNVDANRASNVLLQNLAVGDRTGNATMYAFEQANWNSLLPGERPASSAMTVAVVTLDELLDEENRIDVVRMDVEGYETRIVKGMRRTLERHRPILIVELHGNFLPYEAVHEFLIELRTSQYEIKYLIPKYREEIICGFRWPGGAQQMTIDGLLHRMRYGRRDAYSVVLHAAGHGKGI
jgi:FkbM family methyltransferase